MPKKLTEANSKDKWNFYFPKLMKAEMHLKLIKMGLSRRQSALLRALVRMFNNNELPEARIIELVQEETYITATDKISVL